MNFQNIQRIDLIHGFGEKYGDTGIYIDGVLYEPHREKNQYLSDRLPEDSCKFFILLKDIVSSMGIFIIESNAHISMRIDRYKQFPATLDNYEQQVKNFYSTFNFMDAFEAWGDYYINDTEQETRMSKKFFLASGGDDSQFDVWYDIYIEKNGTYVQHYQDDLILYNGLIAMHYKNTGDLSFNKRTEEIKQHLVLGIQGIMKSIWDAQKPLEPIKVQLK